MTVSILVEYALLTLQATNEIFALGKVSHELIEQAAQEPSILAKPYKGRQLLAVATGIQFAICHNKIIHIYIG